MLSLRLALTTLAGGLAIGCGPAAPPPAAPARQAAPAAPPKAARVVAAPATPDDGLVADDGRTLWVSPTRGEPIDPSALPGGAGLLLWLRPQGLLSSDEGERVWRALGPAGAAARDAIEAAAAGRGLGEVDAVVVGVAPGESYDTLTTSVGIDPQPAAEAPLLSREFEQLLATSDRDRHATLLFSPRFVLGDGGSLLTGAWAPLRELLLAQLDDSWSAAALSLHLDGSQRLYWELRVMASADAAEVETARGLARRAGGWESAAAGVVSQRDWAAHSAEVVRRSPAMWRVVGRYARRGTFRRQAIVNGYLPAGAAHQILLAGERMVAELASPAPATTEAAAAAARPESLAERLQRPVTVSFRREPLETAVAILSDALGAPIEVRGRDLQLEGITRNQMVGLDVSDKPAADALVEVLRRANPDPLAEGPSDARQRLVYVVSGEGLTITTRAAAERRGDPLPDVFLPR